MKIQEHIYKPLPSFLTIAPSNIHGLGLHATQFIEAGTLLGISHVHSSMLHFEELDISFSAAEHNLQYYMEGNHGLLKGVNQSMKTIINKDNVFPNSMIRTPLGGFINHSENENCSLVYLNGGLWGIITLENIHEGEELTLNYQYTPCGVIKQ